MKKKSRSILIILLLLLFITLICVGITIWALFFRQHETILTPDYQPPELEENVEPVDDDGTKLEAPAGGGAIRLEYSDQVTIDLSDKKASLSYTHPASSLQNIVLQIVIKDEIIVQSGTILPGHRVTTLDLLKGAESKLQPGGYNGEFVILSYNPETGEKAMVNTRAKIFITVQQ